MLFRLLAGLLAAAAAAVAQDDTVEWPPVPPRQTAVQRAVIERVQRTAPVSSAAATEDVLRFMDDADFRAHLRGCCPSVARLSVKGWVRGM